MVPLNWSASPSDSAKVQTVRQLFRGGAIPTDNVSIGGEEPSSPEHDDAVDEVDESKPADLCAVADFERLVRTRRTPCSSFARG
jgi:hypothetical protein